VSYRVKEWRMASTEEQQHWVLASQAGDQDAFEELIKSHQRMIHSLAYRMTGSLADAEDLAQETFIQAHHKLGQFRGEASFSSWLYRIAVNTCLNWRKREQRREAAHLDFERETSSPLALDEGLSGRVHEALQKLHPKQRAALVLTVYEGLNHAEAARALGCSETTVSWRIFAARKKLKRLLKDVKPEADSE
jgi:RNA polymerase sigma-70 factor, ECF subfamily